MKQTRLFQAIVVLGAALTVSAPVAVSIITLLPMVGCSDDEKFAIVDIGHFPIVDARFAIVDIAAPRDFSHPDLTDVDSGSQD